jgi:hypothetical protein
VSVSLPIMGDLRRQSVWLEYCVRLTCEVVDYGDSQPKPDDVKSVDRRLSTMIVDLGSRRLIAVLKVISPSRRFGL